MDGRRVTRDSGDELERVLAEAEAEAERLEAEVERRRRAVLDEHRRQLAVMADLAATQRRRLEDTGTRTAEAQRRTTQVLARHELEEASRRPSTRLAARISRPVEGFLLATALGLASGLSAPLFFLSLPAAAVAWLLGRGRRRVD